MECSDKMKGNHITLLVQWLLPLVAADAAPTHRCDVIVSTATPTGVMAAVAAARQNVSVLLLEPGDYIALHARSNFLFVQGRKISLKV